MRTHTIVLLALIVLASCKQVPVPGMSVHRESCMQENGKTIELYKLTNEKGMFIEVTNYAASLTSISAPDRNGIYEPVILGFDSLSNYLGKHPKFGATVGRFANRIKDAQFSLGGQVYHLEKNSKGHSIHGGTKGFNHQVFETDTCYTVADTAVIVFKYRSIDREGGFPGNLELSIAYKLTNRNEVILDYMATTDKPTVINFTNHTYFNLAGCKMPVLDHLYAIEADSITSVDSEGIPTGALIPVKGTEYDFTSPQTVRERLQTMKKGYDINYKLNKRPDSLALAATVIEPVSGRVLKAYTTEPGMQFYIPNSNMDYLRGHGNQEYGRYYGFCLEMQHFPDSPNNPQFPTTVLLPGDVYRQITIYKFETLSEQK